MPNQYDHSESPNTGSVRPVLAVLAAIALMGGLICYIYYNTSYRGLDSAGLVSFNDPPQIQERRLNDTLAMANLNEGQPMQEDNDRIRAPELDGGIGWLNCGGPIRMEDLRGKVVLLDFWTYCCINCIHVLPDLEALEKKYAKQLVVIGVHSAKFEGEKDSENIREAILRYNIEHPVVNDANHVIWQKYSVRSWPTFMLIDPEGYLVGRGSGEGLLEPLDDAIAKIIETHREKKTLNEEPIRFDLAKYKLRKNSPLYFPGKILADKDSNRLYIADSSYHRIVITDLDGKKIDVIGDGVAGATDGKFSKVRFNDPQGMVLMGDTLFVADRKNHLIRAVDLQAKTVSTVAGTGQQGRDRRAVGNPLQIGLNSPWALLIHDDTMYIAMAGHHQIWQIDMQTNTLSPFAGTGHETLQDGTWANSAFAQPSGLATDGEWLFVADSEISAIRAISLGKDETVKTIVGEGLFDFGDIDGVGNKVRLQHALAVVFRDGKLYIADTYNNKIKIIDPKTRSSKTYLGTGKPGRSDSPPTFDEPAGLSLAGDSLYVADTNNHRIRVINLKDDSVRTLKLTGVKSPDQESGAAHSFPNAVEITVDESIVPSDGDIVLEIDLNLEPGFKLDPTAPIIYLAESAGNDYQKQGQVDQPSEKLKLTLPANELGDSNQLKLSLTYYPCREGAEGFCLIKSQIWTIPLKVDATLRSGTIKLLARNTK